MTIEAAKHGYAFATVRPRGDRDFEKKIINLSFVVEEGTRAYIERINIIGNTRTRDYVIRREFDIGEGDAYNRALIDRAERRLKNLELLQDGQDHQRARLGARPRRHQCRRRRAVDRRVLDLGRLFDLGRLPGRGQRRRAQPHGPRRIRQGDGKLRPVNRGVGLSFVEPYLLGYRMAGGIDLFGRQSSDVVRIVRHADGRR